MYNYGMTLDVQDGAKDSVILVVEDERPLASAISSKLTTHGFDVVTARTVEQAKHYLEEVSDINLVWLDHYLLGKETGLDFVAYVKSHDNWKHLPIFVVTNTGTHDKESVYLHLGVDKYFVKSMVRLNDIVEEIKRIFESQ